MQGKAFQGYSRMPIDCLKWPIPSNILPVDGVEGRTMQQPKLER